MEGAPKSQGPEGGENGGENLQELRDKLKSFLGSSSNEAKTVIAKNEKFKDVTADNIDDLSDEDLKELNKAVEEYLSSAEVLMIDQHVNKLMGLSFAAFFSVIENFEREHPGAPKLKGYSRKAVEEFVRANLSNPGAGGLANISEFEERLAEQQRVVDQVKQQRGGAGGGASGGTGGAGGNTGGASGDTSGAGGAGGDTGGASGDTSGAGGAGGAGGDTGGASGDTGHGGDPTNFETKKKEKVEAVLNKLFGGANSLRPGVFLVTDPNVAFDDPANAYDRAKAEERLLEVNFMDVTEDNLDERAQEVLDRLLKRKKIIEDINTRFEVHKIKKVLADGGLTTYTGMSIPNLKALIKKLEADGNDAENKDKRKKRKRGRCVGGAIIATGLAAVAALSLVSLFGGGRKQAAVKTAPTEITMDANELEGPTESTEGITDLTEPQNEIVDETAAEDVESQESMWDTAHGNDARGLWASMDGEDANPDKDGSHDLVAASEFAEFTRDKLETEDGQQAFKDHLVDVATREGVVMEQIADYAQQHGDLDFLPASIRGLEGEELEDAIKENRDGCYDELVKNLQEKLARGDVLIGHLMAGTYDNYFAHLTNPDAPATIDNLELEHCQTWENGAPAFKITFEDGSAWMMKGKCIQLVELVMPPTTTTTTTTTEKPPTTTITTTTTETTPPNITTTTAETSPPNITTTTTTETTPPTTTTTTTPETPPSTTTTTTTDNSKHEEALAAGQGADVAGAEEGYRIVEDASQEPYVYDFTAPVSPDALNADQTFIEYNFADETQAQEADQKALDEQKQQNINAQRGMQEAESMDMNKLGGSGV